MKKLLRIYGQGWVLLLKALMLALLVWIVLLPLQILNWAGQALPAWLLNVLGVIALLIYLPFAAYGAWQMLRDLNRTDHQFVPLMDRIRGKK